MNIFVNNDYKGVLECLQPHLNVQKVHICGYQEVKLCDWLSSNVLVYLIDIKLSDCVKLESLPRFDQFPLLKRLGLQLLPCIEYIDNNNYPYSSTFLPSLEKLSIVNMPNLKGWWKGEISAESSPNSASFHTKVPCLCQLTIDNCPKLASIPWHAPLKKLQISMVSLQLLDTVIEMTVSHCVEESSSTQSKVSSFELSRMDDLEFMPKELFYYFKNLEQLTPRDFKSLQMSSSLVQHRTHELLWKEFQSLRFLHLYNIPKLEYLPNGIQHVTTLQTIRIEWCLNLKTLPEWMGSLTSLSELSIILCPMLTSLGKRYEEGRGEDWQKISHIPRVNILYLWH
ncbi:putative disease resistance protein RGA1 isoform X2 [Cucurbita moschata]|uniref:Disease resistance protein RGA1 isoform X2 n=1 Tax=Cucurbita moschata TaxID=3662 RepID=A0A6J1FTG4_CUCMO|nr:putative disease resistance protein RGA1 isoform X2 [Cucurbita moschata]